MRARSGIPRLAGLTLTVIGNSRAGVPRIFPTVRPVSGTRFASEKGPFGRDVAAAQRISEGTSFGGQMRARAYSLHHNGYDKLSRSAGVGSKLATAPNTWKISSPAAVEVSIAGSSTCSATPFPRSSLYRKNRYSAGRGYS
jgi:hypothetical protein